MALRSPWTPGQLAAHSPTTNFPIISTALPPTSNFRYGPGPTQLMGPWAARTYFSGQQISVRQQQLSISHSNQLQVWPRPSRAFGPLGCPQRPTVPRCPHPCLWLGPAIPASSRYSRRWRSRRGSCRPRGGIGPQQPHTPDPHLTTGWHVSRSPGGCCDWRRQGGRRRLIFGLLLSQ